MGVNCSITTFGEDPKITHEDERPLRDLYPLIYTNWPDCLFYYYVIIFRHSPLRKVTVRIFTTYGELALLPYTSCC